MGFEFQGVSDNLRRKSWRLLQSNQRWESPIASYPPLSLDGVCLAMVYHHRGRCFSSWCFFRSLNCSSSGHSSWWELNLQTLDQCFFELGIRSFFSSLFHRGLGMIFHQRRYESVCVWKWRWDGKKGFRLLFRFWLTIRRLKGARIRFRLTIPLFFELKLIYYERIICFVK